MSALTCNCGYFWLGLEWWMLSCTQWGDVIERVIWWRLRDLADGVYSMSETEWTQIGFFVLFISLLLGVFLTFWLTDSSWCHEHCLFFILKHTNSYKYCTTVCVDDWRRWWRPFHRLIISFTLTPNHVLKRTFSCQQFSYRVIWNLLSNSFTSVFVDIIWSNWNCCWDGFGMHIKDG